MVRVGAAFAVTAYMLLSALSAALWIAAFGTFVVRYAPFLVSARVK